MKRLIGSVIFDIIMGAILTALTIAAFYFEWMPTKYFEYKVYDAVSNLKEKASDSPIVIVAIDDESIANMGSWPWPRAYIARMIEFINKCEAKVIGTNIIYSENDMNQGLTEVRDILKNIESSAGVLKNVQINSIYASLKESEKKLDNDAILGAAIGESKKVVLPVVFIFDSPMGSKESEIPVYLKQNSIPVATQEGIIEAKQIVPPIADFATKALALGHVNVVPDADGTVRSEPLALYYEGRAYPSLGLQLSLKYLNYDMKDVSVAGGVNFGNNSIATSDKGEMLISFSKSFPYFSFYDVASNKAPPEAFKNKIVIIAQSAISLGDLHVTPIGSSVPSWGITANVADNILSGDYIVRPAWAFPLEIAVIVFFGLFLALITPRLKITISVIASLIILLVWIGAGVYLLMNYRYWVKLVHPSLLMLIGYTLVVTKAYFFAGEAKEHIEADSVDTNKMLGLSFQGQGMLDLAFEKFCKCPVDDASVKELLYNLGLDFERKQMFNEAVAVYQHISQAGTFKDIEERAEKLRAEIPLEQDIITIGRRSDNDIIDNQAVSDYHERIEKEGDFFFVEEANSRNGAYINGERISEDELHNRDAVLIGVHELDVLVEGAKEIDAKSSALPGCSMDEAVVIDAEKQKEILASQDKEKTEILGGFIVIEGSTEKKDYLLTERVTTIGKEDGAGIHLKGFFAPQVAALVDRKKEGYSITPAVGKTLKVNSQKVDYKYDLKDGDIVEAGGLRLQYYVKE